MCLQSIHSKCPAAARVGFIPVLPTADKIQSKCPAAARVGINPTPTWMYAALLHSVGAGFIPALPTADKIQSKYPAAARVGINPTPTLDVCCRCLIISGLQRN